MSGGKGGSNQTVAFYYAPVAFAVCEGPIVGIKKIWAGGNLIFSDNELVAVNTYQGGGKKSGPTVSTHYETFTSATQNDTQTGGSALGPWTCYLGTETQPADPTIGEGVAYRGVAYIVFNPLNLGPGATIPPLTFEVVTQGALNPPQILEYIGMPYKGGLNWVNPTAINGHILIPWVNNNSATYANFDPGKNTFVPSGAVGVTGNIIGPSSTNGLILAGGSGGYYNDPITGINYSVVGINESSPAIIPLLLYNEVSNGLQYLQSNMVLIGNIYYGIGGISLLYLVSLMESGQAQNPDIMLPGAAQTNARYVTNIIASGEYLFWVTKQANDPIFWYDTATSAFGSYNPVPGAQWNAIVGTSGSLFAFSTTTLYALDPVSGAILKTYSGPTIPQWTSQVIALPSGYLVGMTNGGMQWLNPETGSTYTLILDGVSYPGQNGIVGPYIPNPADQTPQTPRGITYDGTYVWVGDVVGNLYKLLPPGIEIIPGTMTLPAAVEILCQRAGLIQYDVSLLPAIPVNFVRGDTVTARSMLQRLSQAYFFSMVDSGGVLKFVPWGQPSLGVIPLEDLGFDKVSANAQTPFTASRISGVDLPRSVKIRYISPALNWEKYEQVFALESYESGKEITLDLPLILDDQTAYNIAALACTLPHAERMQYSFTTSYKWLAIEPGDVWTLPFGTCRILTVKMGQKNGIPVLDFTACIDGINALAGAGYATPALPNYQPNTGGITALLAAPANLATTQVPGSPTPHPIATAPQMVQTVPNAGVPKMVLTEPPPLSSTDTGMRFMTGAYSTGNAFPGAAIFQSSDGGNTYTQLTTEISATLAGYANTVLPAPTGPYNNNNSYTWDNFSTVDVYLLGNGGDLTPAPDLNVMNGANGAMLGSELIQFANATLMTDSLGNPFYRLGRLLRGRRGTEWAMGTHQAGEPFYAIPSALSKEPYTPPMLNNAYLYKVVMMGGDLGNAPAKSYEPSGASLMQWAPCEALTTVDTSGDWTISWVPRARYNGDFASGYIPYLDPDTTGWSIDILSGTTVVRTIQVPLSTTAPWQTVYTAAMQSADGFSAGQTGIAYNLYQLSQSVGRGAVTSGTTGAAPAEI